MVASMEMVRIFLPSDFDSIESFDSHHNRQAPEVTYIRIDGCALRNPAPCKYDKDIEQKEFLLRIANCNMDFRFIRYSANVCSTLIFILC